MDYLKIMYPLIESGMQRSLVDTIPEKDSQLYQMLAYHMGWEGVGAGSEAQGKRIRPQLLLLSCAAGNGDWEKAMPAAWAVEFLHNFSLIHDDIEDNSILRRGRETVWKKWGIAQAINAGDLMFSLAQLCMLKLKEISIEIVPEAMSIFNDTAIQLTRGQYLDLAYETQFDISLDDYWSMVSGKTAALLACCTEVGALVSGEPNSREKFRKFGYTLGLAFQVQDDWMGIWGDETSTGKSVESDLVTGKKTLPVLFAVNKEGKFAKRWREGSILPSEVASVAELLAEEGAKEFTEKKVTELLNQSILYLDMAAKNQEGKSALSELIYSLAGRKS